MSPERNRAGAELELFGRAGNWKSYFGSFLAGYLGKRVLEVGAGRGDSTAALCGGRQEYWLCLEPEPRLASVLRARIEKAELPPSCQVMLGRLPDLPAEPRFDTLLYVDVLEHIPDDHLEVKEALARLNSGGHLVVVAPAFMALFTRFDSSIGHFRRYSKKTLASLAPKELQLQRLEYLDSLGFFLCLGNRVFLRREIPTPFQVSVWNYFCVPLSRILDPLICRAWGRSILAIWQKTQPTS